MNKTVESSTRVWALGQVVLAPYATKLFQVAGYGKLDDLLAGHSLCYWGKVNAETARANDRALPRGRGAVSSLYELEDGTAVYVLTDEQWSETTVYAADDIMEVIYGLQD